MTKEELLSLHSQIAMGMIQSDIETSLLSNVRVDFDAQIRADKEIINLGKVGAGILRIPIRLINPSNQQTLIREASVFAGGINYFPEMKDIRPKLPDNLKPHSSKELILTLDTSGLTGFISFYIGFRCRCNKTESNINISVRAFVNPDEPLTETNYSDMDVSPEYNIQFHELKKEGHKEADNILIQHTMRPNRISITAFSNHPSTYWVKCISPHNDFVQHLMPSDRNLFMISIDEDADLPKFITFVDNDDRKINSFHNRQIYLSSKFIIYQEITSGKYDFTVIVKNIPNKLNNQSESFSKAKIDKVVKKNELQLRVMIYKDKITQHNFKLKPSLTIAKIKYIIPIAVKVPESTMKVLSVSEINRSLESDNKEHTENFYCVIKTTGIGLLSVIIPAPEIHHNGFLKVDEASTKKHIYLLEIEKSWLSALRVNKTDIQFMISGDGGYTELITSSLMISDKEKEEKMGALGPVPIFLGERLQYRLPDFVLIQGTNVADIDYNLTFFGDLTNTPRFLIKKYPTGKGRILTHESVKKEIPLIEGRLNVRATSLKVSSDLVWNISFKTVQAELTYEVNNGVSASNTYDFFTVNLINSSMSLAKIHRIAPLHKDIIFHFPKELKSKTIVLDPHSSSSFVIGIRKNGHKKLSEIAIFYNNQNPLLIQIGEK